MCELKNASPLATYIKSTYANRCESLTRFHPLSLSLWELVCFYHDIFTLEYDWQKKVDNLNTSKTLLLIKTGKLYPETQQHHSPKHKQTYPRSRTLNHAVVPGKIISSVTSIYAFSSLKPILLKDICEVFRKLVLELYQVGLYTFFHVTSQWSSKECNEWEFHL